MPAAVLSETVAVTASVLVYERWCYLISESTLQGRAPAASRDEQI